MTGHAGTVLLAMLMTLGTVLFWREILGVIIAAVLVMLFVGVLTIIQVPILGN